MANEQPGIPANAFSQAYEEGKKRDTFHSFDDEGVTATVGTSGQLLQIIRYFPNEKYGVCVDAPGRNISDSSGWTLSQILEWANDPLFRGGIGPDIDSDYTWKHLPRTGVEYIHDRWPTFEFNDESGAQIELQYVAAKGTIFQTYKFDCQACDMEKLETMALPGVSIKGDVSIQKLEHRTGVDDEECGFTLPDIVDGSVVRTCDWEGKGVSLFITAFEQQERLFFAKESKSSSDKDDSNDLDHIFTLNLGDTASSILKSRQTLSITIAYTLLCSESIVPPQVSPNDISEVLNRTYESQSITKYPELDFCLRRNLEHILSVCSIPVGDEEQPAIALTCGDIDGHHVATAASFYAFELLLLARDHFHRRILELSTLEPDEKPARTTGSTYIYKMVERIERVCKGHIKWLFERANREGGLFCANYWVNGDKVDDPNDFLANTPFQIIKTGDFYDAFGGQAQYREVIQQAVNVWIEFLHKQNKLGVYAFPSDLNTQTQKFYLTDHALIWQALRAVDRLGIKIDSEVSGGTIYSSKTLQQNSLKRFTTENPITKRRMVAVTRSVSQTRFLFRSNDSPLFRAMELGFFDKRTSITEIQGWTNENWQYQIEPWVNTVDSQKSHEDNNDTDWNDQRRLAIAIIMAQHKRRINMRPTDETFEHAISTLIRNSAASGLFPGKIDDRLKPVEYDDDDQRDTYWGATFEIPYILWKYCRSKDYGHISAMKAPATDGGSGLLQTIANHLKLISDSSGQIYTLLKEAPRQTDPKEYQVSDVFSMKRYFPFGNRVEAGNIVELQDEWLYREPSFFNRPEDGQENDDDAPVNSQSRNCLGFVIDIPKNMETKDLGQRTRSGFRRVSAIDVKRLMEGGRTPEKAEKRFWHFFSSRPLDNKVCLETCTATGKEHVDSFFSRHKSYQKFFREETVAALNSWMTEFHLFFYDLDPHSGVEIRAQSRTRKAKALSMPSDGRRGSQENELTRVIMSFQFEGDFWDRYWTCRLLEADKPTERRYREVADQKYDSMNDLYQEQYYYSRDLNGTINEDIFKEKIMDRLLGIVCLKDLRRAWMDMGAIQISQISWQQRRVLELLLFGKIIRRMHEGANNILTEAWSCMRRTGESTQNDGILVEETEELDYDALDITTDSYFVTRKLIKQVQQILQLVEGDLEENLAQIVQWGNRERDRDAEKPRWTFHDESRYHAIIRKLHISNEHDIQKVRRIHLKVSKFEALLAKTLDTIRSDLEERRAGDIQRFTYVTVVFLPLGFATGVFSMSEAPSRGTLESMIITAVVALTITAFSLFAAKLADDAGLLKLPAFMQRVWDICVQSDCERDARTDGMADENPPTKVTGLARRVLGTGASWRRKARPSGKNGGKEPSDVEGGVIAPE